MKTLSELKKILHENRDLLIKKYKVKTLGIFGSYVRNEQNETSDIDVLVEFQENSINFDNYMGLKYYLEELSEKNVDLVIKDDLKVEIRDKILKEVTQVKIN